MDVLAGLLLGLVVLAIPFVVPIVAWVSARRVRRRVYQLEERLSEQHAELIKLGAELAELRRGGRLVAPPVAPPATEPVTHPPVTDLVPEAPTTVSEPAPVEPIPATEVPEPPIPAPQLEPVVERIPPEPSVEELPVLPEEVPVVPVAAQVPAEAIETREPLEEEPAYAALSAEQPPASPPPAQPEPETVAAGPAAPSHGLEGLVVRVAAAGAGIALVVAAVFFLRYSVDRGWLQPPVRVAIGVIVAVGLLVTCERKAARRYPATANALDAAAIAILFATFFAAHALWNLIPSSVTFGLLGLVTALAVMLSIRHESLFIAVLGLLGGFATPALLSTGENRPIPLFAYLLLLNIGLAWVAYRRTWPVLTWLTLILTTIYQWGWVFRFLDSTTVPLAMGVFIVFPLVSVAALLLSRRRAADPDAPAEHGAFERTALLSAAIPALFAIYLAAVPAYAARPGLLFGFVLLVDLGLFAVAIARRQELMHATGAMATMLAVATWLAASYHSDARVTLLAFTAAFVLLYLFAPVVAARWRRPFTGIGERAALTGPMLFVVFPVLAGAEPAFANPWPLFVWLAALLLVVVARAMFARAGKYYFVAAFFAVAAQAVWSATHLTMERLGSAVALYVLFGVIALAVPVTARRLQRPFEPVWGSGAVLIASLLLLLFIALGDIAPAATWALALLLAILNAAVFVESAAGRLPLLSHIGSVLSWIVLATWWGTAAASVGVIPSLGVLTGLSLITLAGHAWASIAARRDDMGTEPAVRGASDTARFANGMYLALAGHLFLMMLAMNGEWSIPPWPLFGSLVVMTLAVSAASLVTGVTTLHAAGTVAAAIVIAAWAPIGGMAAYGLVALVAAAAASAYATGWIRLVPPNGERSAAVAAVVSLFIGEVSALSTVFVGSLPPFPVVVMAHAANLAAILWLTARYRWKGIALAAVAPASLALLQWQALTIFEGGWLRLLILAISLYSVFVAYPLVLGRRARGERDPYYAAVIASVMFFFAARAAFVAGNLEWMMGVVPVATGLVLAILLRQLLAIESREERDIGRLALVAGAALACATVAIPLQLERQWITIGWALEGAALAWLFRRIPHRGLLYSAVALLAAVFVRLALNPEVLIYEPRGTMRILNWYLYTYLLSAAATIVAGWWLSKTEDRLATSLPRASQVLPAAGVILLFILLNIEIADFYATGPTVTFRFGVTVSQDLTYTIAWLLFGMGLLAAGIYLANRPGRVAAVALIAVTTFKCFLYDLGSLAGLYRIASFVGLAMSLALVSLALQKYVLSKPRGAA